MNNFDHALRPSTEAIGAMRVSSNAEIAGELLDLSGLRAVDIGCGEGKFTRLLADRGARVLGIDVNAASLERARAAAAAPGQAIEFLRATGETLPFEDAGLDLVVFSNSLHHMMHVEAALREAHRVLRQGGLLYVMEPVAAGPYHEATKLVNDESLVRAQAYAALVQAATQDFTPVTEVLYRARRRFARYEDWRDDQIRRSDERRTLFATRDAEIRGAFERHADGRNSGYAFDQIFRINLLRKRA